MNEFHISEKDNNTTFVTTAIDYPNALPHIGTAFEKIGADVYARFRRFQGRDVYFTMGNDENTVKVLKAAKAVDKHPQPYVDEMAEAFKAVWKELNISFDDFIQTSEDRHLLGVQRFLRAVNAAGYIEKRPYKALYCEGCEEFKSPNSLDYAKRCPNHTGTPLVEREEENHFFLLSAFKQRVADLIYPTPFLTAFLSVEPESRYNEVTKFINTELTDISISRRNEGWGIPIPWDDTQATYVWFDALLNYLTVIGFGNDWEKFQKYWPAEVHFIGKDITRFHCALFPAMCMAYNEGCDKLGEPQYKLNAFPQRVFAHGFVNQKKGNQVVKISKSGDSIRPGELIEQFGSDAYRYYFLSKFNYDTDGEYSLDHFREVYNADLANSFGNLVSRTVGMSMQYFDGKIPPMVAEGQTWLDEKTALEYEQFIVDCCSYRHALELTWKIIFNANKLIENSKPWELVKLPGNTCGQVLGQLIGSLRIISLLIRPFTPAVAEKIYTTFQWAEGWNEVDWGFVKKLASNNFLGLENGIVINRNVLDNAGKFPVLFPRAK
jgi:methionyl-tRNA synthetase